MKRITFPGGSIVTGAAVADAILAYVTEMAHNANSVTLDVPVLEPNGKVSTHTLLVGPASQLDVADVDGMAAEEEAERFPAPEFPPPGMVAVVPSEQVQGDREDDAEAFDKAVADLDRGLDAEMNS